MRVRWHRSRLVPVAALVFVLAACGQPMTEGGAAAPAATATPTTPRDVRGAATAPGPDATTATGPGARRAGSGGDLARPTATERPPVVPPTRVAELPTGIVEPVRLEIPSIGVDAAMVGLSLGTGDPEVPSRWQDAGWYETTRNPGEIGPAVIAGHIDSKAGPAVFFRLRELANGDEVIVHGADGQSRTFVVEDSGQYPKTDLPDEVFGFGQARPELRLITCGGSFDSEVGHYVDNLVVYAHASPEA